MYTLPCTAAMLSAPATLEFGIAYGRPRAWHQSRSARTASLVSLAITPRRTSGVLFTAGFQPSGM